jgi:hypothetical protein
MEGGALQPPISLFHKFHDLPCRELDPQDRDPTPCARTLCTVQDSVRTDSTDRDVRLALARVTSENLTRIDLSG